MKVFVDLHHGDLYYSLHRLFVERLGFELYRPIGLEWFTEGFWKVAEPYNNAQDTINQFLDINERGYAAYSNLNGEHYFEEDIYHVYDPGHDYHQKAITLEKFKSMQFDIIIPSISQHDGPYTQLQQAYQPQAKVVAHLGNGGQRTSIQNVITSTPFAPNANQRTVYVHQEIDPNIYKYTPPNPNTKNIFSMVNCLPHANIYNQYKQLIPEANFKAYGASTPDGALDGSKGVGAEMVNANIGWQLKPKGGLGHTAMGWFFSGRPVVVQHSENVRTGGDAALLFQPGINCIDIEANTVEENCNLIRKVLEPEENALWGERAYNRIKEIINYDEEEQNVRKFLEELF